MDYPARQARIQAGYTAKQAAKQLRITPSWLLRCEQHGFPYELMRQAQRLYGCDWKVFLTPPGTGGRNEARARGGRSPRPAGAAR